MTAIEESAPGSAPGSGAFRRAQRSAHRHETGLIFLSRPAAWLLFRVGAGFGPIRKLPKLGWVVSDPVMARTVLTDARHFSVFEEGGSGHLWRQVLGAEAADVLTDEGHLEIRRKTQDLFTEENSLALVRRSFGPIVEDLKQRLLAGEQVDVSIVARALVGRMAADLVGLDLARAAQFAPRPGHQGRPDYDSYQQVFDVIREFTGLAIKTLASTQQDPAVIARSREIVERLTVGMEAAFASAPGSTVLGRCREAGLTFAEARGLSVMMLVAATETGATSMTRAVALLSDTGQLDLLRERAGDKALLDGCVREVLRVTSPATVVGRHITGTVELGGRTLHDGDRVLLLIHTANNASGRFDVTRAPDPMHQQLWFGAGRHICLGAPLARAEIGFFLSELLSLGRGWRVARRSYARGIINPSYARLLMELT